MGARRERVRVKFGAVPGILSAMFIPLQRQAAPWSDHNWWGQYDDAAGLPNVAGSSFQLSSTELQRGDVAWAEAEGALYVCSDPASQAAVWDLLGGGGGLGVSPGALVLRPGAVPTGNIFADWPTLFAAYQLTDGPVTIEFDDALAPITLPAGSYAFREATTLEGILRFDPLVGNVGTLVELADGVVFDPPPNYYRNGLILRSLSSTPIVSVEPTGGPTEIIVQLLERGTTFQAGGAAPFFEQTRLSPEGGLFFFLVLGGQLSSGPSPVVNLLGDVGGGVPAAAQFNVLSSGSVQDGAVAGNALGIVFAEVDSGSEFSLDQPGYGFPLPLRESITVTRTGWMPTTVFDAGTIVALSVQANMTVRCDPLTAGPMAVTLPSANGQPGNEIIIKNVTGSANSISIAPIGGDTIDGAPALILGGSRAVVKLQSDGVSDWMVVV